MLPEELYKRRHFGTPETLMLIVVNYVVVAVGVELFAMCDKINWFFWVIFGGLIVYNAFTLRKNWSEFDRIAIIAYVIGAAGLPLLFLMF